MLVVISNLEVCMKNTKLFLLGFFLRKNKGEKGAKSKIALNKAASIVKNKF